ncbi:MAG: hypothetical protein ACLTDF_03100 [Coprococcus sp.]
MVRKLYLIAGLYAACVIGAVLSGCSIYDKEDLSKMVATRGRRVSGGRCEEWGR